VVWDARDGCMLWSEARNAECSAQHRSKEGEDEMFCGEDDNDDKLTMVLRCRGSKG
jgi:hypothetical protein